MPSTRPTPARTTPAPPRSSPTPTPDSFDPNAHLYEHTIAAHRRYLNFEGIGYGSQSQRQRQYAIHKLERAFDRVSEYRANKLFDEAAAEHVEAAKKKGGVSEEEEREFAVAQVAMRHQRQAKRKAGEVRKVEEMIDAAMVDWATEAPTLSAFGRPFTPAELMVGVNSQDILTQSQHTNTPTHHATTTLHYLTLVTESPFFPPFLRSLLPSACQGCIAS